MIEYLREFNQHKLQPTSHFFKQLLENDKKKFNDVHTQLVSKKQKIDNIVARYNQEVNLQGCIERLGRFCSYFKWKLLNFDKRYPNPSFQNFYFFFDKLIQNEI